MTHLRKDLFNDFYVPEINPEIENKFLVPLRKPFSEKLKVLILGNIKFMVCRNGEEIFIEVINDDIGDYGEGNLAWCKEQKDLILH